ncbi:MAG: DUF3365 domain-containing protein [Pseudomonadota bacterium]
MAFYDSDKANSLLSSFLLTAILWSILLGGLLTWNIRTELHQTIVQATHQTRTFFKEFLLARFWNFLHGGVYVPISEETPPNPYLDEAERVIVTTDGQRLAKINPAYMTRQIAAIAAKRGEFSFHITGLHIINPENNPDPWEENALKEFKEGGQEYYEMLETKQGEKEFRYMGALVYEESCLPCHSEYGCKAGDVSGGISVSMPSKPLIDPQNQQIRILIVAYASFGYWESADSDFSFKN